MEVVNVDDWEKFLEKNENALILLNECCSYIADSLTYTSNVINIAKKIDGLFSGLKLFKKASIHKNICTPDVTDLNKDNEALAAWFNQHNVKVIASLDAIENILNNYNNEYNTPEEKAFLLRALDVSTNVGVFWALYYGLKNTQFGGLAFLAVYGADAAYDKGNFIFGDGASNVFKALANVLKTSKALNTGPVSWKATGFGMVIVMAYNAALYASNDEGEWTVKDTERMIVDATSSGLEYAGWTALTGYFSAGAGSILSAAGAGTAVAGPVGAAVGALGASVIVYAVHPLVESIGDLIVGDNIISVYVDSDGNEFKIPRNGNGEKGTYDIILERTKQLYKRTDATVTNKIAFYKKCENGYQSNELDFNTGLPKYSEFEVSKFNKFLKDIENASSPDEIPNIIIKNNCVYYDDKIVPASYLDEYGGVNDNVYLEAQNYGFDAKEYYAYTHDDYSFLDEKYGKGTSFEFMDDDIVEGKSVIGSGIEAARESLMRDKQKNVEQRQ